MSARKPHPITGLHPALADDDELAEQETLVRPPQDAESADTVAARPHPLPHLADNQSEEATATEINNPFDEDTAAAGLDVSLGSFDESTPLETHVAVERRRKPREGIVEAGNLLADEDSVSHRRVQALAIDSEDEHEVVMESFDRFLLIKRLAYGGMGEIFLARHVGVGGFEKLLVIKRLLPHYRRDPNIVRMFFDEARLQGMMRDRHIAEIYEMGETDGQYFIAMEYVHGVTLRDLVAALRHKRQRIHPAHAIEVCLQVSRGLAYAHNLVTADGNALDIVHRDINPHNILLSYDGECKVIDFGIAKSTINDVETELGTIKGKFAYMSPEQAKAEPIDRRSDVFSLGIVLYELLTNENPFHRDNVVLSLEAVSKYNPPPVERRDPKLAPLAPIVERCLNKDPDQRFADCAELAGALAPLYELGLIDQPKRTLVDVLNTLFRDRQRAHLELMQSIGSGMMTRRGNAPPSELSRRSSPNLDTTAPEPERGAGTAPEPERGAGTAPEPERGAGTAPVDVTAPAMARPGDNSQPMMLNSTDFEPLSNGEFTPAPILDDEEPLFDVVEAFGRSLAPDASMTAPAYTPSLDGPPPPYPSPAPVSAADTQPTAAKADAFVERKRRPFLRFVLGMMLSVILVSIGVLGFFFYRAGFSVGFEGTPLAPIAAQVWGTTPVVVPEPERPKVDEPEVEPKLDQPKVAKLDEPKVGEPKLGEPKVGEPKVGEPKVGEPKVGEPKVGEPKVGEPKVGEPKVDQPKPKVVEQKVARAKPKSTKRTKPRPKVKPKPKPAIKSFGRLSLGGDARGSVRLSDKRRTARLSSDLSGLKLTVRAIDASAGNVKVRVESKPWAIVFVGKRSRGKTPELTVKRGSTVVLRLKNPKLGERNVTVSFR